MTAALSQRECVVASELGAVLGAAGYTEDAVKRALDEKGELVLSAERIPLYARRLNADVPLRDLLRLFLLGESLPVAAATHALAPVKLSALGDLGLVEQRGDEVSPLVNVLPFRDVLLVHDPDLGTPRMDHVSGVSSASRTLAAVTMRQPVEMALDVGSGCGVQALLAARHSAQVVATDLNPRAVHFTRLSAALSGIVNVDARQGSLFEPARGSSFDLIVGNLPYVISPDRSYIFRDSGEPGDSLSKTAVVTAGTFLREGGFAQIMVNWVSSAEDWSASPRSWVEGSGCDAWVLRYHSGDPLEYAAGFLHPLDVRDPAYEETLDRWLDYYRQEGFEEITAGLVVLRRRSGRNWIRADRMPLPGSTATEHILRVFAAQDDLARATDDRILLDSCFRLVDEHRLEQTLRFRAGQYEASSARLNLENGVGVVVDVPATALAVLFHFDGTRPLREVLLAVSEQTGSDPDTAAPGLIATVRRLYELGFLVRI